MRIYDDLRSEAQTKGMLKRIEQVEPWIIREIKATHPAVPTDFLSFLEEIGCGELGGSGLVLYGGLVEPTEIYDEVSADGLRSILIFGDDMQGYCSGFDIEHGWAVVEIEPVHKEIERRFDNFSDYIRDVLK